MLGRKRSACGELRGALVTYPNTLTVHSANTNSRWFRVFRAGLQTQTAASRRTQGGTTAVVSVY